MSALGNVNSLLLSPGNSFCYFPLNPTTRLQHGHAHVRWAARRAAAPLELQSRALCREPGTVPVGSSTAALTLGGSPWHPPSWEVGVLQVSAAPSLPRSQTSRRTGGLGLLTAPVQISTRQKHGAEVALNEQLSAARERCGGSACAIQQAFPRRLF